MSIEDKTNDMIKQLSTKASKPVKRFPLQKAFAGLLVGSFIYIAFLLTFAYGVRTDFIEKLKEENYVLELGIVTILILISYKIVIHYATPREKFKPYQKASIIILFSAVATLALTFAADSYITMDTPVMHMHCFADTVLFSLPTAIIGFLILKKNATTHPGWTGFSILALSGAIGYFGVRLTCEVEAVDHQAITHLLPVALYAILGFFIGRKILSW